MDPPAIAAGVRLLNVAYSPRTGAGKLYQAVQARATELAPGFEPEAGVDLTFHGGKTIADLTYTNIYLGGQSKWSQGDVDNIDGALAAAMSDIGLNNMLAQYFDGRPPTTTFRPSQFREGQLHGVIFKDQVEQLVLSAFGEGLFANFDLTSTVFNFLLPQGIVLSSKTSTGAEAAPGAEGKADEDEGEGDELPGELKEEADSAHGLGGYHGGVHPGGGTETVYYSVGVFSEHTANGDNGIVAFDEPWKNVVATFYHELVEARTDADVENVHHNSDIPMLGWYSLADGGGEIGDIPINEAEANGGDLSTVFVEIEATTQDRTIPIQLMWSNAVHGPEGPVPEPHPPA